MAAGTTIHITHGSENAQTVSDEILKNSTDARGTLTAIRNLIHGIMGGSRNAQIEVTVETVAASKATGTITCATAIATNTLTIGPQTLTIVASGATANQVNVGGSNTLTAAAIVAKINAHAVLSKYVTASNLAGVITITALQRGTMGNGIVLSSSGSTLAVSGTSLAGAVGQDQSFVAYSAGV